MSEFCMQLDQPFEGEKKNNVLDHHFRALIILSFLKLSLPLSSTFLIIHFF